MNASVRFLTDYRGRLTDDAHYDVAGSVVDRYSLSTCSLLVEAGVAEWVEPDTVEPESVKPKRGRKAKAATE